MNYSTLTLFDVRIDVLDEATAVEHIIERSRQGHGGWVVTPNVEQLRCLSGQEKLRQLVSSAELSVADGMPLIWASRIQGSPLPERVSGSHLIWSLTEAASGAGHSIFLLGGTSSDIASRASRVLMDTYPSIRIAGSYSPPYGFEDSEHELELIRKVVAKEEPDIVYCGLGFPKQEALIQDLRKILPHAWFIACGASISMVAGERTAAPSWMQRYGFEWMHRLRQEPVRLFKRYILRDIPFAFRLLGTSALCRVQNSGRLSAAVPTED